MLCRDPCCEVREAEVIPLQWALGAACGIGLLSGGFFMGDSYGANRVIARNAKAEAKAIAAMEKGRKAIDTVSGALSEARRDQDTETRVIYHEATRIVERQSRAMCVDADGVRLFDTARASANRAFAFTPSHAATGASPDAAR